MLNWVYNIEVGKEGVFDVILVGGTSVTNNVD